MTENETQRQISAIWKKVDAVESTAREGLILAKHADKGYIESYSELKSLRADQNDMKKVLNVVRVEVGNLEVSFTDKLSSNLRWILFFIFGLLGVYSGLIIFILNQIIVK